MSFLSGFASGLASNMAAKGDEGGLFNSNVKTLGVNPSSFNLDAKGQIATAPPAAPTGQQAPQGFMQGLAQSAAPQAAPSTAPQGVVSGFASGLEAAWAKKPQEPGAPQPQAAVEPKESSLWERTKKSMSDIGATLKKTLKPIPLEAPSAPAIDSFTMAKRYVGLHEAKDTKTLQSFFKKSLGDYVDPVQTPWCAAFVNSIERSMGRSGTGSYLARSFLKYGAEVKTPTQGDIVVFTRGNPKSGKGHVGLVDSIVERGGQKFVKTLGGNQNDQVSYKLYPFSRVLGFRRPPTNEYEATQMQTGKTMFRGLGN